MAHHDALVLWVVREPALHTCNAAWAGHSWHPQQPCVACGSMTTAVLWYVWATGFCAVLPFALLHAVHCCSQLSRAAMVCAGPELLCCVFGSGAEGPLVLSARAPLVAQLRATITTPAGSVPQQAVAAGGGRVCTGCRSAGICAVSSLRAAPHCSSRGCMLRC